MEAAEYETLFAVEENYWWFRALRNVLIDACRASGLPADARVLDAGCGTGMLASVLRATGARTYAFDLAAEAPQYWPRRGITRTCRATVNAIPFASGNFDAVFAIDLLECDGVDERQACEELLRVVRPGGWLFLMVPAYDSLMSPDHHRAVHASRRYTRQRIIGRLSRLPVQVVRTTHLFMTVFPLVAGYRLWRRLDGWNTQAPRSELRPFPRWINASLFRATDWERMLMRWADLRFGSSILVVARRADA